MSKSNFDVCQLTYLALAVEAHSHDTRSTRATGYHFGYLATENRKTALAVLAVEHACACRSAGEKRIMEQLFHQSWSLSENARRQHDPPA